MSDDLMADMTDAEIVTDWEMRLSEVQRERLDQAEIERVRSASERLAQVAEEFKALAEAFQMAVEEWAAVMATIVAAYSEDEAANPEESDQT
jgi:hypothetical protein